MNYSKEEKEAIERIQKRIKDNEDYSTNQVWLTEDVRCARVLLNLIQKQEKIIDKATEILQEAKLAYFTKEDGGELIGQYRCFNKDDWKKYLKKEVEKDVKD